MASSILSSNTGGRILTIRPDSGVSHDASVTEEIGNDGQEFDQGSSVAVAESWERRVSFSVDPFAGFNRSSEALEIHPLFPDLTDLPTQSKKYELGKRIFDIVLAIAILPLITLLLVLIGATIFFTAGGPVFFRQRRIGQHGRGFYIWKFRTMRPQADRILVEHLKRDAAARDEWNDTHKLREDPRITRLGRLLRKTSLDELPQILNVLSGDMSFVGPRPIVKAETVKYAERFPYYLAAVPGITGLWQVSGRCNVSYESRVILDETYVCKWSLTRDLWILLKTPKAVCHRDGAY